MNTHKSPHAKLQPIQFDKVRINNGFWKQRINRAKEKSLPELWRLLADPNEGHTLQNLQIAAGLEEGTFEGVNWNDAWMGKWLESATVTFSQTGDKELENKVDGLIDLLAKAQEDDGYLASQTQARGEERFQDPSKHELYTMGHIMTAGVLHHRLTGKTNFLKLVCKIGDFMVNLYSGKIPRHMVYFPFNPSNIMSLVELYRVTGNKSYLKAAQGFVDRRGSAPRDWGDKLLHDYMGGDHCQDRIPLREENEMVGHSVLSTYLYCGAADVVAETGEKELFDALKRIWSSYTKRKMFLNGGTCAIPIGISNRAVGGHKVDAIHEAAGPDYFLPNALSYNETCAQIGAFMWASRMLNIEPEASYGDVMEQILYAGILSGVDLKGEHWFYRNMLRWHGGENGPYGKLSKYTCLRFKPGRRDICCPTNMLRTEVEFENYLYSTTENELWCHLYADNTLETTLPSGQNIHLSQETEYPWDGTVKITLRKADCAFSIKLRIPAWAKEASVSINGNDGNLKVEPGTYLEINRSWQTGDTIQLTMPMTPRLLIGNPLIEETRGQVAVMRGPVVYCLEGHDLPKDIPFHEICIPKNIKLTAKYEADLLNGVTVLEGTASQMRQGDWDDILYQDLPDSELNPVNIKLIPYFTWANRGVSTMSIWLPLC